jgi:hypothetical protein
MRYAIDRFQKTLFTIILFASGFSGIVTNLAESSKTGFLLFYDAAMIGLALMSLGYLRGRLIAVLLFIIGCIALNLINNGNSLIYSLNGLREILTILSLVVFFNGVFKEGNEELAEEYIYIMKRFAIVFLVIQLPVAGYQFSVHGPSDWVGGTYGVFGSGNLTLSIICLVFFMSHFVRNNTQRVLLYLCLLPLFLNETKVSFVLIPMLILFIHFQPKLKSIIGAGVAAAIALFIFSQLFTTNIQGIDTSEGIAGIFNGDFINNYLFGDIDQYTDVPRFTKIVFAWQLLAENTMTFLFGIEYGIFRQTDVADASKVSQSLEWLMSGTRPYLFFLLVQGGILLITGFFWMMFHINRYFTSNNNKYKTFLFLLFVVILFYNDALRSQNFAMIYLFSVFLSNSDLYREMVAAEE